MDFVLELNIRLTVVTTGTSYFLMFLFIYLIFLQSNVYEYLLLNFNGVLLNTCIYSLKNEASKNKNNFIETRYDYLGNFNS